MKTTDFYEAEAAISLCDNPIIKERSLSALERIRGEVKRLEQLYHKHRPDTDHESY